MDKDESRYEGDWESNQRSGQVRTVHHWSPPPERCLGNGVLRLANGDVVSGVYRQHCIVQGVWNGASGNRYVWGQIRTGSTVETSAVGTKAPGKVAFGMGTAWRRCRTGLYTLGISRTVVGMGTAPWSNHPGSPTTALSRAGLLCVSLPFLIKQPGRQRLPVLDAGERVLMFDVRPSGNVAELLTPAEAPTPAKKPAGGKPKQDDAMLNGEPAPLQIAFDDPHVPAFYFCVVDAGQRIVAEESKRALIVDVRRVTRCCRAVLNVPALRWDPTWIQTRNLPRNRRSASSSRRGPEDLRHDQQRS